MDLPKIKKGTRVSAHTHIKGLGLNSKNEISGEFCGLYGQVQARKVRLLIDSKQDCKIIFF